MAVDQTGVRISELTAVTTLTATDNFIVETAAGTRKITKDNLGRQLSKEVILIPTTQATNTVAAMSHASYTLTYTLPSGYTPICAIPFLNTYTAQATTIPAHSGGLLTNSTVQIGVQNNASIDSQITAGAYVLATRN